MQYTYLFIFLVLQAGVVFSTPSYYSVNFEDPPPTESSTASSSVATSTTPVSTTSSDEVSTQNPDLQCSVKGECEGGALTYSIEPKDIDSCLQFCKTSDSAKDKFTWASFSPSRGLCKCFEGDCNLKPNTFRDDCTDCVSSQKECEALECAKEGLCQVSLNQQK